MPFFLLFPNLKLLELSIYSKTKNQDVSKPVKKTPKNQTLNSYLVATFQKSLKTYLKISFINPLSEQIKVEDQNKKKFIIDLYIDRVRLNHQT